MSRNGKNHTGAAECICIFFNQKEKTGPFVRAGQDMNRSKDHAVEMSTIHLDNIWYGLWGLSSATPQLSSKNLRTSCHTFELKSGGLLHITGCHPPVGGEKSQLSVSTQGQLGGGLTSQITPSCRPRKTVPTLRTEHLNTECDVDFVSGESFWSGWFGV